MSAGSAGPGPDEHLIHVEDAEVEIVHHPEDWLAFVLFWAVAFIVFLQFFTRYILNDSLAWTEEIARYLLMCVGLLGGSLAVRRYSHIHVEFMYLYMPAWMARALSPLLDVL